MKSNSEFIDPSLTFNTLDNYIIRSSILMAIRHTLPKFSGTLLDVGCGQMPYKSVLLSSEGDVKKYIGLDLINNQYSNRFKPDLLWDGTSIPLENETVDCVIATEVLEHCPNPELIMQEILRVLKQDGIFFFTVPFLWPLHDVPYDEYRYTPYALMRHLKKAGFEDIELKALGGWDASLAQMIGLWIRRRFNSSVPQKILRLLISPLLLPLIWFLKQIDVPPEEFGINQMFTGISGVANKSAKSRIKS